MTKLSQKITGKIKKEKLSQKPKIIFLLKNIMFWGLYVIAAVIGALAFSVVLLAIFETDFEATHKLIHSPLDFVRTALPFTWIFLFALLSALAFFGAKHTKKGYRFTGTALLGINMAISVVLGLGLYVSGFAHAAERSIAKNIPVYKMLEKRREEMWQKPENGLLAGEIAEKWNGEFFVILDASEKKWNVRMKKDMRPMPPHLEILLGIQEGEIPANREKNRVPKIKVVGVMLSENEFEAERIFPWKRHRLLPEHVRKKWDELPEGEREEMREKMRNFEMKKERSDEVNPKPPQSSQNIGEAGERDAPPPPQFKREEK